MITRELVLQNPSVREAIEKELEIKIDFDKVVEKLLSGKERIALDDNNYIASIRLFRDYSKNIYLLKVRFLHNSTIDGVIHTIGILLDNNDNLIEDEEEKLNDLYGTSKWTEVEGCQFCCETNVVLTSSMKNGNDIIYSDIRMDCRPEDDLWQIDNEISYQSRGDNAYASAEWSNDAIDINYCPICGRRLRQGKPMLYRGINVDYNHENEK